MKSILAAALACTALQASAQVYKCPGPAAAPLYTSAPCTGGKAVDVRPAARPSAPETPSTQVWRRARDLKLGMSADAARRVWGQPERVNRSTTAAGVREQWVYGTVHKREYLYFYGGVLVSIQD